MKNFQNFDEFVKREDLDRVYNYQKKSFDAKLEELNNVIDQIKDVVSFKFDENIEGNRFEKEVQKLHEEIKKLDKNNHQNFEIIKKELKDSLHEVADDISDEATQKTNDKLLLAENNAKKIQEKIQNDSNEFKEMIKNLESIANEKLPKAMNEKRLQSIATSIQQLKSKTNQDISKLEKNIDSLSENLQKKLNEEISSLNIEETIEKLKNDLSKIEKRTNGFDQIKGDRILGLEQRINKNQQENELNISELKVQINNNYLMAEQKRTNLDKKLKEELEKIEGESKRNLAELENSFKDKLEEAIKFVNYDDKIKYIEQNIESLKELVVYNKQINSQSFDELNGTIKDINIALDHIKDNNSEEKNSNQKELEQLKTNIQENYKQYEQGTKSLKQNIIKIEEQLRSNEEERNVHEENLKNELNNKILSLECDKMLERIKVLENYYNDDILDIISGLEYEKLFKKIKDVQDESKKNLEETEIRYEEKLDNLTGINVEKINKVKNSLNDRIDLLENRFNEELNKKILELEHEKALQRIVELEKQLNIIKKQNKEIEEKNAELRNQMHAAIQLVESVEKTVNKTGLEILGAKADKIIQTEMKRISEKYEKKLKDEMKMIKKDLKTESNPLKDKLHTNKKEIINFKGINKNNEAKKVKELKETKEKVSKPKFDKVIEANLENAEERNNFLGMYAKTKNERPKVAASNFMNKSNDEPKSVLGKLVAKIDEPVKEIKVEEPKNLVNSFEKKVDKKPKVSAKDVFAEIEEAETIEVNKKKGNQILFMFDEDDI